MNNSDKHVRKCDKDACRVCISWRTEKIQQAKPYLKTRKLKRNPEDTTLNQW